MRVKKMRNKLLLLLCLVALAFPAYARIDQPTNLEGDSNPQLSADLDGQNFNFDNVGAIRFQSNRDQPACTPSLEGSIFYNSTTNILNFCDDTGITQVFSSGGVGLSNVVDDPTPQFGANFDANGFTVTGLAATTQVIHNIGGSLVGDADFVFDGDALSLGGVTPVAGTRVLLPLESDAVTPSFAFGDGDTGF